MNTKFTVMLALAAGLLGGLSSRYFIPAPVYAQGTPQEIRAQKFVLVDEHGVARGVFGMETNGEPALEAIDTNGRVYIGDLARWSSNIYKQGPIRGPKQPTLLPAHP